MGKRGPKTQDPTQQQASQERERLAARSRAVHAAGAEIGVIPSPADQQRRDACERDLLRFLTTYFPNSCGLRPFGPAQILAIRHLEHTILHHGRRLNLLPRGFAKSTISECAVLWAALYGHRKFILILGANEEAASQSIEAIQSELQNNDFLDADFPSVTSPIAHIQGKFQRCASQTHQGTLTGLQWNGSKIVLPTIAGSAASGVIISSDGLLSAKRGSRHKRADGVTVRPDLVILDDVQTDKSVLSPAETATRLRIIKKSVLRLGGHGRQISACMNATTLAPGDLTEQLSDPKQHPGWQVVKSAAVTKMPTALESHWFGPYAKLLKEADPDSFDSQQQALAKATAYYEANRSIMDDGETAWPDIPLEPGEVSALQHFMNIWIIDGNEVFQCECQNQPPRPTVVSSLQITNEVSHSYSGYGHRVVPPDTSALVFGVDCHDEILYYTVAAVKNDFTGCIIDYGTWPEQPSLNFSHDTIKVPMAAFYGDEAGDADRLLEIGLEDLLYRLLNGDWHTANGDPMPISCGLVDCGYKPANITSAIKRTKSQIVLTTQGMGCPPTRKQFYEWDMSKAIKAGPDPARPRWYLPMDGRDGHVYKCLFDADYWKSCLAVRLTQRAAIGRWTIFDDRHYDHMTFTSHLMSESPSAKSANGRTVNQWEKVRVDNHWFDASVLCTLAASLAGCRLPTDKPLPPPPPRRAPQPPPQPEPDLADMWTQPDGRNFFISAR